MPAKYFMQNKFFKKTPLLILFLLVLVLGGAYAGYREYMSMRQVRLIKQARKYVARSDMKRAQLCLRGALAHNPKDLEAWRVMAQLAEASRSPAALMCRSHVVELNPRSLEDRLALAQTASMLHEYATATNALQGVLPKDKKTADYQRTAGMVAKGANHFAEAEMNFLEAARLEPANMDTQLDLAAVRLLGTNTAAYTEARTSLRRLASTTTNSALRCAALRGLAVDAMRWKQMDSALAVTKELLLQTNSLFEDRLLLLDVLEDKQDAGFRPALAACQHEAAREQTNIFDLAIWERARISPKESLGWLRSLPANNQTNQPVVELIAECYTATGDWAGLRTFLENQNWAELEFVRHAYLARALRGQNLTSSSRAQWERALKLAGDQRNNLFVKIDLVRLLHLAEQFGWRSEREDILWTIVNEFPNENAVVQTLTATLLRSGRTRSLMQLFSQELKRSPSDLSAKNNLAMTALLLDEKEVKPLELSREVYQKQPTNSDFASTYAFALYLRTNNAEALKVLEQLSPRELEDPSVSGCYGLVLQASGHATKARKYLDLTSKALLLPEERLLIEKAKSGS
jgi:predicted Zn-dependent protease